jgi:hypothetical protein
MLKCIGEYVLYFILGIILFLFLLPLGILLLDITGNVFIANTLYILGIVAYIVYVIYIVSFKKD